MTPMKLVHNVCPSCGGLRRRDCEDPWHGRQLESVPLFGSTEEDRPPLPPKRILAFTVLGDAKPAGSKSAFVNKKTGRVHVTDSNKNSKPWQAIVRAVGFEYHEGELMDGPLAVTFAFYRVRPNSHYGTGRNSGTLKPSAPPFPATRPDVLKLARGVEDALTGIVWTDDARIVEEVLRKRWGHPARVEIEVREL